MGLNLTVKPKILAIGGAGIKIAAHLKERELAEFDILGVDLATTPASFEVFPIGGDTFEMFGSGGDPEVARRAAEEKLPELEAKLQGLGLVYLIAGLGGGTASALAPMIAELAVKNGAFVVVFATLPFALEGGRRVSQAREALGDLRATGALVVALPNDTVLRSCPNGSAPAAAMERTDAHISRGIRGLTGMLLTPGLMEVDAENIKNVMHSRGGKTLFAYAEASGEQVMHQIFGELIACGLVPSPEAARTPDHLLMALKISSDIGLKEINTLTAQLAEKFVTRGEKIVGAVVEPSWTEPHVELMVIGQSDPEVRKKHLNALQAAALAAKVNKEKKPSSAQTEFGFNVLQDQRGVFDDAEPNIYRGEDVDVPTYLRRGVKVIL